MREFILGASELPTTYRACGLIEVGASWVIATFIS